MHKAATLSGGCVDVNGRFMYVDSPQAILGVGAYGTVFLGKDKRTGDAVAIKKIESAKVKKEELEILKVLQSKHIVGLIDVHDQHTIGFDSKFTYVVMELCDGDLEHHLKSFGRLDIDDFNAVSTGLALGYAELYKCNIVHRDIKPQNMLLQYKWVQDDQVGPIKVAKLTDFGISRQQGSDLQLVNLAGTPLYMAPEIGANIIEEHAYDAQCDMWSIGVLLYECLAGELPYDESGLCKLFLQCATGGACEPKQLPSKIKVPRRYQLLLNDLLQLESKKRLRPLELLARALDAAKPAPYRPRRPKLSKRTFSTCEAPSRKPSLTWLKTVPDNLKSSL